MYVNRCGVDVSNELVEGDRQHAVKGYDEWSCMNKVSY